MPAELAVPAPETACNPERPRPSPAAAQPVNVRAEIEEAAQCALDNANGLIALLDGMDGEPDDETGGDDEPDLGSPEGRCSSPSSECLPFQARNSF